MGAGIALTDSQNEAVVVAERLTSSLSLAGLAFIFLTFSFSPRFNKPINRLMFYCAWGDAFYNIATLVATDSIAAGADSILCQFQGFMIEIFLLSDILWNLSMAINVYLTVFAKYDSSKLKALETRYLLFNYGAPFILALTLCFIETESRGKVYGPALIWCWISIDWDFVRIVVLYAPAWVIILIIGIIYLVSGMELFRKRRELEGFTNNATISTTCSAGEPVSQANWQGAKVQVTTEMTTELTEVTADPEMAMESVTADTPYSVTIEGQKTAPRAFGNRPSMFVPSHPGVRSNKQVQAREKASAAWSYTKCAILFFMALLITWLPSSINRVYSLINPTAVNWPLNLAASIVLPLMGFWNTCIYVFISWRAVRELFFEFLTMSGNTWRTVWRLPPGLVRSSIGSGGANKRSMSGADMGSGPWRRMQRSQSGSGDSASADVAEEEAETGGPADSDVNLTTRPEEAR